MIVVVGLIESSTMFHARAGGLWGRLRRAQTRPFCQGTSKSNNADKIESSVSSYNEAYKQLDKLDFMTAAKILFTDPPKKKKFGIDFHLELEEEKKLEEKKRQEEEEQAKELELKEEEEKIKSNPVILEVTTRLGKLEDTVNEIVAESKKQSSGSMTKNQANTQNKSELSSSIPVPGLGQRKLSGSSHITDTSQPDQMGNTQSAQPSDDAKN